MSNRFIAILTLGFFYLVMSGCPSIATTRLLHKETGLVSSTGSDGLIYYLPKKLLKLTVTRKAVPPDSVKKAAKEAEEGQRDAETAKKAVKETGDALDTITKLREKFKTSTDAALKSTIENEFLKRNAAAEEKKLASKAADEKSKTMLETYQNAVLVEAGTVEVLEAVNGVREKRFEALNLESEIVGLRARNPPTEEDKQKLKEREASLAKVKKELEDARKIADATFKQAIDVRTQSAAKLFEDDVTITELPAIPDTSHVFVSKLSHWMTREDHLHLTTTPAGLLKTAVGESLDKTPQILQDAAKLAITLATGLPTAGTVTPGGMRPLREEAEREGPLQVCPDIPLSVFEDRVTSNEQPKLFPGVDAKAFVQEFTFDPTDFVQVMDVNSQLCMLQTRFLIRVQVPTELARWESRTSKREPINDPTTEMRYSHPFDQKEEKYADGLVYRRPVPYIVELFERLDTSRKRVKEPEPVAHVDDGWNEDFKDRVFSKQKEVATSKKSATFILPNKGPVSTISFEAGFFVQTKFDIGFDEGMLTKLEVTKPSEIHALIQLPLAIVKDIIAVPTELLQLKFNYASKDTELLNAQKANIEAQRNLERALEEFRANKPSPAPVSPAKSD